MNKIIDFLRERLNIVTGTCYGLLVLIVIFSFYVDRGHAHTWVERDIPFFWSVFGFLAAAAIIGIARWYGHSGIMARKDFYDKPSECRCSGAKEESSCEHV